MNVFLKKKKRKPIEEPNKTYIYTVLQIKKQS